MTGCTKVLGSSFWSCLQKAEGANTATILQSVTLAALCGLAAAVNARGTPKRCTRDGSTVGADGAVDALIRVAMDTTATGLQLRAGIEAFVGAPTPWNGAGVETSRAVAIYGQLSFCLDAGGSERTLASKARGNGLFPSFEETARIRATVRRSYGIIPSFTGVALPVPSPIGIIILLRCGRCV